LNSPHNGKASKLKGFVVNDASLDLLKDYALLKDVARDLDLDERTLRRKINAPGSKWSCLRVGNKIRVHIPTLREIIAAETQSKNPRRGAK
jgi:hypothetical protein